MVSALPARCAHRPRVQNARYSRRLARSLICVAALSAGALPSPADANTAVARTATGGSWSDASGWNPNIVPNNGGGTFFDVSIPSSPSITAANLDLDVTIEN